MVHEAWNGPTSGPVGPTRTSSPWFTTSTGGWAALTTRSRPAAASMVTTAAVANRSPVSPSRSAIQPTAAAGSSGSTAQAAVIRCLIWAASTPGRAPWPATSTTTRPSRPSSKALQVVEVPGQEALGRLDPGHHLEPRRHLHVVGGQVVAQLQDHRAVLLEGLARVHGVAQLIQDLDPHGVHRVGQLAQLG